MNKATDGLGNEINVGDTVVWLSGTGKKGGVVLYTVRGITPKRVAISNIETLRKYPDSNPSYAAHNVVLVVNSLITHPLSYD